VESFTSNAPQLAAQLQRFAARVGDPHPALERMRALLARGEQEVWGTQGAAIGFHWAAPAEAERKSDPALLVATGALRSSLTSEGAGERATEVELRFGTDVPYARFHQFGTGKMPARPILGIPSEVDQGVGDVLASMLAEAER
jgi:phage gpG-like protein